MLACRHFYPYIHDGNIVLTLDAQRFRVARPIVSGMQKPSDTFVLVNRTLNRRPATFASIFYLVD